MLDPCDFGRQYIGQGIFVSGCLWALAAGGVHSEEVALTASAVQFEDFELELPAGLSNDEYCLPEQTPITKDEVALGHVLFFDARLSADNTVSCATCHTPQNAFADGRRVSLGINSREGHRNAPTIINRAFSKEQFWDGRAGSLEEQAKAPLINPEEMGMPSHEQLVEKLRAIKGYRSWFKKVFGREVHIDDIAKAITAFELTVLSGNSRFDQYKSGKLNALSEAEQRGFELFEGKARCSQCHSGANFTDEKYHNLGIDWNDSMVDVGRYRVSNKRQDIGAFKTPTLREIEHTSPYMHNGVFESLKKVVEFYNQGGIVNPFLDVEMRRPANTLEEMLDLYDRERGTQKESPPVAELARLYLTQQEQADLVAFMKALSGEGWQHIESPASFPE